MAASRVPSAALLAAAALTLAGCGGDASTPAEQRSPTDATTGGATERSATNRVETPAPSAEYAGSDACRPCHAAIFDSVASSAHALAAWRTEDAPPSVATAEGAEALTDSGAVLGIGGRRRAALVARTGGTLAVTTTAWTPAAGWHDASEDERAVPLLRPLPFGSRCARCHPAPELVNARELPLSPPEAASLPPGVSCESCHGPAAAHAADPSVDLPAIADQDFDGCAHCHAQGTVLPREGGRALLPSAPFLDHVLPTILAMPTGPSPSYFVDGRPASTHGYAVQALVQSACFREGEATCTTCHDPHGGGLRDADPDAACRSCHEDVASRLAAHSRHPAPSEPVPSVLDEPNGPNPSRAPGCVDCHAPAVLRLGPDEAGRDHSFGSPDPVLTTELGVPNACATCHADVDATELAATIGEWFPGDSDATDEPARRLRARAFAVGFTATGETTEDARREAAARLAPVLAGDDADPWTRASAAELLGGLGRAASDQASALAAVVATESDPLLRARAARALGRVGGSVEPLLDVLEEGDDWRVRLAAANGLVQAREPRGLDELERLRRDDSLPPVARAVATSELGVALLRRGVGRRAELLLAEATRLRPDDAAAWLNLGTARASLGDDDGARLAWNAALDVDPDNPYARANLAALDEKDRARREAAPETR